MASFLKTKRRGIQQPEELQLNSLVDIFSTLIFFLLQLFAAGSESVVDGSIRLPISITEAEIKAETVIGVTPAILRADGSVERDGSILVEGIETSTLEDARNQPTYLIPGLQEVLKKVKQRADIALEAGLMEKWDGRIIIQSDRDIDFEVIKRVMATAGVEGFSLISLAVSKSQ